MLDLSELHAVAVDPTAATVRVEAGDTLAQVDELCGKFRISGVPVTDHDGRLVGIITNRDMRFEVDHDKRVAEVMTKLPLITAQVGVTADAALGLLRRHKIEKLPIVDGHGKLRGLITVKDIQKKQLFPNATKDPQGRLRVAASVGVGKDSEDRVAALLDCHWQRGAVELQPNLGDR